MRCATLIFAVSTLLLTVPYASAADQCEERIAIPNSLLVTNPLVVHDTRANPDGPWHFSSLIFQMLPPGSGRAEYSTFIEEWLSQYNTDFSRSIIGAGNSPVTRLVPARTDVFAKILDPWLRKSRDLRHQKGVAEDGTLEPSLAPFILRAIVNRSDLRLPQLCQSDAGQGRFVFATLEEPTTNPIHSAQSATLIFNVILEYRLPTTTQNAFMWAEKWAALSSLPCTLDLECEKFRGALQEVTQQFTQRDNLLTSSVAAPRLQIRTNDVMSYPGELREFSLSYERGRTAMKMTSTHQTPDFSENQLEPLGRWVFENRVKIRNGIYELPESLIGFSSPMPRQGRWNFPNVGGLPDQEFQNLRFQFARNTCNGCHNSEFPRVRPIDLAYHVSPHGEISRFLTEEELPKRLKDLCSTLALTQCHDQPLSIEARSAHARIH